MPCTIVLIWFDCSYWMLLSNCNVLWLIFSNMQIILPHGGRIGILLMALPWICRSLECQHPNIFDMPVYFLWTHIINHFFPVVCTSRDVLLQWDSFGGNVLEILYYWLAAASMEWLQLFSKTRPFHFMRKVCHYFHSTHHPIPLLFTASISHGFCQWRIHDHQHSLNGGQKGLHSLSHLWKTLWDSPMVMSLLLAEYMIIYFSGWIWKCK